MYELFLRALRGNAVGRATGLGCVGGADGGGAFVELADGYALELGAGVAAACLGVHGSDFVAGAGGVAAGAHGAGGEEAQVGTCGWLLGMLSAEWGAVAADGFGAVDSGGVSSGPVCIWPGASGGAGVGVAPRAAGAAGGCETCFWPGSGIAESASSA